jgi:hypothetical protein
MLSHKFEYFTRRLTDAKKSTEIKNQNSLHAASEFYAGNMRELLSQNKPLLDDLELRSKHDSQARSAHHKLRSELVKCDVEKQEEYISQLNQVFINFKFLL